MLWALVVVPLPVIGVMGAPVIPKVAKSVMTLVPIEKEEKASVGALIRKARWSVMAPLA